MSPPWLQSPRRCTKGPSIPDANPWHHAAAEGLWVGEHSGISPPHTTPNRRVLTQNAAPQAGGEPRSCPVSPTGDLEKFSRG